MKETLYIIDTFSLVFQVFHAVPAMTGPTGQPTNAIFGITRDILNIIKTHSPDYLIFAMDSSGPGTRNDLYSEYKANRSAMPEDLVPQIPHIMDVVKGFQVPVIECPGWEADDVFATIARLANEKGIETTIVTNDKDARQLINDSIRLYNIRKNQFMDAEAVQADWGVRPDQVIDFQSLVGDSVDNIPGVPLVGPKKAQTLIEQFGTLEGVLANADKAKGPKLQQNLKEFADQARMSRELVTLNQSLDLNIDWEASRLTHPDRERLHQLFVDFGFRRFAEDMKEVLSTEAPPEPVERIRETIDTKPAFETFLALLKEQDEFCVDLETTGLKPAEAEIVGWAISWEKHRGFYIPVEGPSGQLALDPQYVLEHLKPILEDPEILITNQNIKYDMVVLMRVGVFLQGVSIDPMVASYLISAGERGHSLDKLSERYLNHTMIPISELIGSGKQQKKMFEVDVDKVAEYAVEDAEIAWQLSRILQDELKHAGLWELYWELERPLISILAEMEFTGIKVDTAELKQQSQLLETRLTTLISEIHEIAGHEFNIASPLQLRTVLFEELNLPVFKKTKTGPSTDQSVLEKLAPLHALPARITEHRHLSKLKSTYLDALPGLVNPETGRIHASFNQVVAATGRLSSSDPNLQNIPVRTEEGRQIRKAFIPQDENWRLLCADYSQIELRILAHLSQDVALSQAFREGADIHTAVASDIFRVPHDQVDSDMRRTAKAVNFGVIYGQSPFGLSEAIGIPQSEAAGFIEDYFVRYQGVREFLDQILEDCAKQKFVETICGRKREIQGVRGGVQKQLNMPERTAINTVIQGSAADLIKQAMLNVSDRIKQEQHPGRMLMQIHDELVFEVPLTALDTLGLIVREEMESAMDLEVPLIVDMSSGLNWLEQSPLEIPHQ
ncbi:DNA polymerase I [Gimesia maris]|uniref:DNA polymerase I n=1 Tax=Gimesia maris TaxID=122 RepID=UPI00241C8009|nr:DNA polymerase I [Gimesia maris]|tara:strand:+ start:23084 stop:25786 length:2703 start_codon:yes stop_codon:yes gene_type:complete